MSLTLNVNWRRDFNQQNMKTEEIQKLSRRLGPCLGVFIFFVDCLWNQTKNQIWEHFCPFASSCPDIKADLDTVFHNLSKSFEKFSLLLLICSHIRSFFSYIFNSHVLIDYTDLIWQNMYMRPPINLYFCTDIWWRPEIFHIRTFTFSVSEEASVISVLLSSLKIWLISGTKSCVVVKI